MNDITPHQLGPVLRYSQLILMFREQETITITVFSGFIMQYYYPHTSKYIVYF